MTVLTGHSERVAEDPGPAAELAPMVEVWFRILADHVPDEDQRCRACTGVRRAAWPCPVRALAEGARQWHALGLSARGRRLPGLRGASCPLASAVAGASAVGEETDDAGRRRCGHERELLAGSG